MLPRCTAQCTSIWDSAPASLLTRNNSQSWVPGLSQCIRPIFAAAMPLLYNLDPDLHPLMQTINIYGVKHVNGLVSSAPNTPLDISYLLNVAEVRSLLRMVRPLTMTSVNPEQPGVLVSPEPRGGAELRLLPGELNPRPGPPPPSSPGHCTLHQHQAITGKMLQNFYHSNNIYYWHSTD